MVEYKELNSLGFPGYRVGNDGSVWSWRCKDGTKTWRWKQLKPWIIKGGYKLIGLNIDQNRHYRPVHHLVLEAFVGPRPEGYEACHNNSDPSDNRPENLRWDTPKGNCKDRQQTKWQQHLPKGEKHHNAKMTDESVKEMRKVREETGLSYAKVAAQFGISKKTAMQIIKKEIWRHV